MQIVDHRTYVFLGDGCLMEGISHEVCSLAGTLRLSKLIAIYDDNGISIDGPVGGWFTDDTAGRFRAYGWHVIERVDGHDAEAIDAALERAVAQSNDAEGRPTLIMCQTVIGHGAPNKQGTHDVHGAPLGPTETAAVRSALQWADEPFVIDDQLRASWNAQAQGAKWHADWVVAFENYRREYPQLADEFERRMRGDLPAEFPDAVSRAVQELSQFKDPVATRKASQMVLDCLAPLMPEAFGGSADLTASNLTNFKGCVTAGRDRAGNHLSYGVREFGMAAIMNGMSLHGGFVPYGGTFLTFSDYSRNAVRMAALMKQRVIHVFTHDSIGLGEDGPTHQAVEHAPALRLIPNLEVWRPADPLETLVAWHLRLNARMARVRYCSRGITCRRSILLFAIRTRFVAAPMSSMNAPGHVRRWWQPARSFVLRCVRESCSRSRRSKCVLSPCRAPTVSTNNPRVIVTRSCGRACRQSLSRPPSRTYGASMWGVRER